MLTELGVHLAKAAGRLDHHHHYDDNDDNNHTDNDDDYEMRIPVMTKTKTILGGEAIAGTMEKVAKAFGDVGEVTILHCCHCHCHYRCCLLIVKSPPFPTIL